MGRDHEADKTGTDRAKGRPDDHDDEGVVVAGDEAHEIESEPSGDDSERLKPEGGNGTVVAGDEAHAIEDANEPSQETLSKP